jgi:hypothetical protein
LIIITNAYLISELFREYQMVFNIENDSYPIITAAIHDGHKIRSELQDYIYINEKDRLREEDPFTGRWLSISQNRITTEYSRFEVDLNRPAEKAVYLTPEDSWGLQVWKTRLPQEIYKKSLEKHTEFYQTLENIIERLLVSNDKIVVYDLHSYNYRRNGPDKPPEPDELNPEINLGTGTLDREKWSSIIDRFIGDVRGYDFMGRKLDIRENIKFKGGYFPKRLHQKYPENICCLSIEFRKFFMDEWTGTAFNEIIGAIEKLLMYTVSGTLDEIKKLGEQK